MGMMIVMMPCRVSLWLVGDLGERVLAGYREGDIQKKLETNFPDLNASKKLLHFLELSTTFLYISEVLGS